MSEKKNDVLQLKILNNARNGSGHNTVRLIKALIILYITFFKLNTNTQQHNTHHYCNQLKLILSTIIFITRLFKERFRLDTTNRRREVIPKVFNINDWAKLSYIYS